MQPYSQPTSLNNRGNFIFDEIAEKLIERGWHVVENYFDNTLVNLLANDLKTYDNEGKLTPAGIGRGNSLQLNENIRGDTTRWLTRTSAAQNRYLDEMEILRLAMNRSLFMGLFDYESHFSNYAPGTFYSKHKDSFRGAKGRILTTVTYLNETWKNEDGGSLILYNRAGESEEARILPSAGTLALFLSEEIPHEVQPTKRRRLSIAGWFRCNTGEMI